MNIYLSWLVTILYYIAWPIYWLLYAIVIVLLFILRPIFFLILYLLQPIAYLGAFIGYLAQLPYYFLKRFEVSHPLFEIVDQSLIMADGLCFPRCGWLGRSSVWSGLALLDAVFDQDTAITSTT